MVGSESPSIDEIDATVRELRQGDVVVLRGLPWLACPSLPLSGTSLNADDLVELGSDTVVVELHNELSLGVGRWSVLMTGPNKTIEKGTWASRLGASSSAVRSMWWRHLARTQLRPPEGGRRKWRSALVAHAPVVCAQTGYARSRILLCGIRRPEYVGAARSLRGW